MTIIHLTAPAVAVARVGAATGSVAQAVTGFGFSLVTAPFLVLLVGPLNAVRLVNLFALVFNVVMLVREHKGVDLGNAARLLAPALVVAPAAGYVVHLMSRPGLDIGACLISHHVVP